MSLSKAEAAGLRALFPNIECLCTPSFKCSRCYFLAAIRAALAVERGEIAEVAILLETLPGGIDYDADPEDESPENAVAHVGGLAWQMVRALGAGEVDGE